MKRTPGRGDHRDGVDLECLARFVEEPDIARRLEPGGRDVDPDPATPIRCRARRSPRKVRFAKSLNARVGSIAWAKFDSTSPGAPGVVSVKSENPSVGNRSSVVIEAVNQSVPFCETWMVASPPAPKTNGLDPTSPVPSLLGSASDHDVSRNPELENTIRSIPNACEALLVIVESNPRVRCPPDPTETSSSVPNAGLKGVTPPGKDALAGEAFGRPERSSSGGVSRSRVRPGVVAQDARREYVRGCGSGQDRAGNDGAQCVCGAHGSSFWAKTEARTSLPCDTRRALPGEHSFDGWAGHAG